MSNLPGNSSSHASLSRRTFCQGFIFCPFGVVLLSACNVQAKPLKIPQNADEIADFLNAFSHKDFTEEELVKALGLTDKRIRQAFNDSASIEFKVKDRSAEQVQLFVKKAVLEVDIRYSKPISVSVSRLEALCEAEGAKAITMDAPSHLTYKFRAKDGLFKSPNNKAFVMFSTFDKQDAKQLNSISFRRPYPG